MDSELRQLSKTSTDRRSLIRHRVTIPVTLREGRACHFEVIVVDISCYGARLNLGYHATPGQVVTLCFLGFEPIRATIIWSANRHAGLKFARAFHYSVLSHLMTMIAERGVTSADNDSVP